VHYAWVLIMKVLPFSAFVGMEELKEALMCLAVDPKIGGLLIIGPKGTGKSSIVRAFARLLPEIEVVKGCPFNDDPHNYEELCEACKRKLEAEGGLPIERRKMRVVDLPIGATEDMVLGTINVERTLKEGRIVFEPGILAKANRNILYIDEVNLLPDHIVDSILDAVASGWNVVEREGISLKHPSRFILIGTMNPEEGELRPQLLDRFAISVKVETIRDPKLREEIVRRNLEFEDNPLKFLERWEKYENELRNKIIEARRALSKVKIPQEVLNLITSTCSRLEVDGYRPDIVAVKVARARAALHGRDVVKEEDALVALNLSLAHRTRAGGLKPPPTQEEIKRAALMTFSPSRSKGKGKSEIRLKSSHSFFRSIRKGSSGKLHKILGLLGLLALIWLFTQNFTLALLVLLLSLLLSLFGRRRTYYEEGTSLKGKRSILVLPSTNSITGKNFLINVERGVKLLPAELQFSYLMEASINFTSKRARERGRRHIRSLGRIIDYVIPRGPRVNIAWAPTLRCAARKGELPIKIRWVDLREGFKEGRGRVSIIIVLDSSASMMYSIKEIHEAIEAVRREAIRYRDRASLIIFKGFGSYVLQAPSTNFNLVLQKLYKVGLSDYTPLASGMLKAYELALRERSKGYSPLIVIISDGNANVSLERRLPVHIKERYLDKALADTLAVARLIARSKIDTVIINTMHRDNTVGRGEDFILTGSDLMMKIAEITKGIYVGAKR